jgi:hypothetical protein
MISRLAAAPTTGAQKSLSVPTDKFPNAGKFYGLIRLINSDARPECKEINKFADGTRIAEESDRGYAEAHQRSLKANKTSASSAVSPILKCPQMSRRVSPLLHAR